MKITFVPLVDSFLLPTDKLSSSTIILFYLLILIQKQILYCPSCLDWVTAFAQHLLCQQSIDLPPSVLLAIITYNMPNPLPHIFTHLLLEVRQEAVLRAPPGVAFKHVSSTTLNEQRQGCPMG